ncbi:MAG: molybdenum cofactor guanylyltransferase [Pseudomonadota bacterium]|nr:molybdenum cofactor guanylyltransferase [Pseudomonadota bacterium]
MSGIADLAICILAGGASSRMGQNKAELRLSKQLTLLEEMLSRFSCNKQLLVFSSGGKSCHGYPQVPDLFSSRLGPVAGIVSSILWLKQVHPEVQNCIFIPVDLAYLNYSDLSGLIRSNYEITYFKDNPLPLKINISAAVQQICIDMIYELQHLSGYSVYKFIQKFKHHNEIENYNPHCLTNLNYFTDWEKYLNEYSFRSNDNPN